MFRTPALAVAVLGLTLGASIAEAGWSRKSSVTGPNGNTVSRSGSGSCSGGSCSASRTTTGPYGNSVSRSGSGSCSDGTCSGSRTTTGPNGNSVTRSGSVSRY